MIYKIEPVVETTDSIITFDNIKFSYEDEDGSPIKLFDGFSLKINRGDFTVLLGHNGSGKSTLAKMMNGMSVPDEGDVTVNGMKTGDESHELDVRKTVGLVFQNPDNQIVSTIVEEDVAFGPENLGIAPPLIRRRVDDALKTVGMYEYRTHATHKLSGGQKQRVAIAGILAMQPECIVLDEPTSMLDPKGRQEVLEVLRLLNKEKGITIVMITHYMEEATLADRVIVLNEGRIILDGTCGEVFEKYETLKEVGLNVPQPTELIYKLRCAGYEIPETVLTVEQCTAVLAKLLRQHRTISG